MSTVWVKCRPALLVCRADSISVVARRREQGRLLVEVRVEADVTLPTHTMAATDYEELERLFHSDLQSLDLQVRLLFCFHGRIWPTVWLHCLCRLVMVFFRGGWVVVVCNFWWWCAVCFWFLLCSLLRLISHDQMMLYCPIKENVKHTVNAKHINTTWYGHSSGINKSTNK